MQEDQHWMQQIEIILKERFNMETPRWAMNFGKYLTALGNENAGLGWGLAHISSLTDEDHNEIIRIITTDNNQ